MPTYEYKCQKCKRTFELVQKMTDPALTSCEVCHGKVKRLIGTGAGLIFKGSGFYCTDYRNGSYKTGAAKEKADSGSTGKTTSVTDKKTEPTPTAKPV